MNPINPTPRTTLVRRPDRGAYDRAVVNAILDEALVCHVGFVMDGQPFVIPTTYARIDDRLYLHGAVGGRLLKTLRQGIPVCVTITLLDGLVLARSAFHHSMNYRSVLILGTPRDVRDETEKRQAFSALVDHIVAGRNANIRGPSDLEMKATSVLCLPIEEASAKIRTGPPIDDEEDYALPYWAGVIPVTLTSQPALADPRLPEGIDVPASVAGYRIPRR